MPILRAATSIADLDTNNGNWELNTNVSYMTDNVHESIYRALNPVGGYAVGSLGFPTQTGDVWVSFVLFRGSWATTVTNSVLSLIDSVSGNIVLGIYRPPDATQLNLRYFDSGNNPVDNVFNFSTNEMHRIDINLKLHPTEGAIKLYVDGLLAIDVPVNSGNLIAQQVNTLGLESPNNGSSSSNTRTSYSKIIIADEETLMMQFIQRKPTGAGTYSEWSGSYADIDETGVDTATFVMGAIEGDRSSYTTTALPVLDVQKEWEVAGVVHSGHVRRNVPGVGSLRSLIRVGGVDHESSKISPGDDWKGFYAVHSGPFTLEELDTSEMGLVADL